MSLRRMLEKLSDERGLAETLFDAMLAHNDLGEVGDLIKDENGQRWVKLEGEFNFDAIAHELAAYLERP